MDTPKTANAFPLPCGKSQPECGADEGKAKGRRRESQVTEEEERV